MNKVIREVLKESNEKLQHESNSSFTPEGFESLKNEISIFIEDIIAESQKISRRARHEVINKVNVEAASNNLIFKRTQNMRNLMSSIGGFLLGLALTEQFDVISNNSVSPLKSSMILATGLMGIFLFSLSVRKN